jgi:hypothetical protein
MVIHSSIGNLLAQIRFYGFMGNVGSWVSHTPLYAEVGVFAIVAGAGKSVIWYVHLTASQQRDLKELVSSTVVEDVDLMRKRGLASMGFFYCDFRDDHKKNLRGLVSSLLVQLCAHSDVYSTILFEFYSAHDDGSRQASDDALIACLGSILKHPNQAPVYIIIDGLDECPNSFGMPSPRERVLVFFKGLIGLQLKTLHICITSRPEVDITFTLAPLPFHTISLHDERGQKQDILNYLNSVVHTDAKMNRWRAEDKELVIDVLTRKADGM